MNASDKFGPVEKVVGDCTVVRAEQLSIPVRDFAVKFDLTIVHRGLQFVVVISQTSDYHGTSVTNAIEEIRRWVALSIPDTARTRWFEHYPAGRSFISNSYSLMEVTFEQGQPSWGRLVNWEQIAAETTFPAKALADAYQTELAEAMEATGA